MPWSSALINKLPELQTALCAWYAANSRPLPFRQTGDAYSIWISEIMAQQTKIAALLPYYERFIERFPSVWDLANAQEDEVLRVWQGLGYYSRARNLKKAARIVCERYGGQLPHDAELLKQLPGIGEYTAGAIASIAYDQTEPAVDGNAMRVFARLFLIREDVLLPKTRNTVSMLIRELMQGGKPSVISQAVMELGALICLPSSPQCGVCPVSMFCETKSQGKVEEYPFRSAPPQKKTEHRLILMLRSSDGRVLLQRRDQRLLHNLWEFPGFSDDGQLHSQLERWDVGLVKAPEQVVKTKHVFTHLIWQMQGIECVASNTPDIDGVVWANIDNLDEFAIPSAFRAFVQHIQKTGTGKKDE